MGLRSRIKSGMTAFFRIENKLNTMKVFYVYILASKYRGVLYVGITSDLVRRTYKHRSGLIDGFTKNI